MFIYKNKVYKINKITFGNIDEVLLWLMALEPELNGRALHFKQKNKKVFKRAAWGLMKILIMDCKKPFKIKTYMFFLQQIVTETKLELIIERYTKAMKEEREQTVHKSDYIQRFMSEVRRAIMPYTDLTYEELNQIGYLELEEYVAELQKREIRRQQTFCQNLLLVVGCVLSKKGNREFEKFMKDMNKAYRELDNIGFDEINYMPDLMRSKYGKQV